MLSNRPEFRREALPPLAPFADNAAHLRAEIDWLHQLIRCEIRIASLDEGELRFDEFAGLYISREEIDRYLDQPSTGSDGGGEKPAARQLRDEVARARKALDRRAVMAVDGGIELRLEHLVRTFQLDTAERTALLCCAACELDGQVSRLFAYLQNDAGKKWPTLALLARLCTQRACDPVALRTLFGSSSLLVHHRLLDLLMGAPERPFSTCEARPAAGIIDFLCGSNHLAPPLAPGAKLIRPSGAIDGLAYHRHHREILETLLRCRSIEGRLPLCYISGPAGAGKSLIADAVAAAAGKKVLRVRPASLCGDRSGVEEAAQMLKREALLLACIIHLECADQTIGEGADAKTGLLDALLHGLADCEVIMTGPMAPAELRPRLGVRLLSFELPYPALGERVEIWQRSLPPHLVNEVAADIPGLASKFRLTPGQVARAVYIAELAAPRDANGYPRFSGADLHAHCRDEAQQGLQVFCQKIVPRYHWTDIVLPPDTHVQLQEICRWVQYRPQVYEAWGFGAKLALGKGVTVLFSGGSGTGKTMSAEIIANELQLDLFRVDLSRIVSKYIGETEKNLSRLFGSGATANSILFFDEADALFGKRTEVKDAHDRYANIEINYLLSEMDRYEGIIIVSTYRPIFREISTQHLLGGSAMSSSIRCRIRVFGS
jgi:hypothetical protein